MELTLNAAHGDQTLCGQIVNGNNNSVSGQLSVDNRVPKSHRQMRSKSLFAFCLGERLIWHERRCRFHRRKTTCWRDCQSAAGLWVTGRQAGFSRISKSADVACMIGRACKALCCAAKKADSDFHSATLLTASEIMLLAVSVGLTLNHFPPRLSWPAPCNFCEPFPESSPLLPPSNSRWRSWQNGN
jgi:hypothetical protein